MVEIRIRRMELLRLEAILGLDALQNPISSSRGTPTIALLEMLN